MYTKITRKLHETYTKTTRKLHDAVHEYYTKPTRIIYEYYTNLTRKLNGATSDGHTYLPILCFLKVISTSFLGCAYVYWYTYYRVSCIAALAWAHHMCLCVHDCACVRIDVTCQQAGSRGGARGNLQDTRGRERHSPTEVKETLN